MTTFKTIEELATYIEEQQLVLLFIKTENCGVCDVMLRKVNCVLENYVYGIYYCHTIICCSWNNRNSSSIEQKEGELGETK